MTYIDQTKTPIFTALKTHWESSPLSGHVPGHKFGGVFPGEGLAYFEDVLKLDATEITGLDDLHDPEGMIEDAQQLAAEFYGAEKTFFLVNGSTVGNLGMILAACPKGSRVLVQRNCHKSVLNGLELAEVVPVFLPCDIEAGLGVATSVSLKQLEVALQTISDLKAVILTNPNYYGLSVPLEDIIERVHENGIPVLVDEAHGAHFVMGAPFPKSALQLGADVVVHSAHKTLPAMTMGSFLHMQGKLVKKERIAYFLRLLQSSSPSYPIMASLDLARFYLTSLQKGDVQKILADIEDLKCALQKINGIKVATPNDTYLSTDPLKLVLRSTKGWSGFELQEELEKEGVFVELADAQNALIILPLAVNEAKHDMIERIRKAMKRRNKAGKGNLKSLAVPPFPMTISRLAISMSQQLSFSSVACRLEDAAGEIAAESIIPYPPGIPVLLKGERITKSVLDYITQVRDLGTRFQGNNLLKSNYIFIYKEEKE